MWQYQPFIINCSVQRNSLLKKGVSKLEEKYKKSKKRYLMDKTIRRKEKRRERENFIRKEEQKAP